MLCKEHWIQKPLLYTNNFRQFLEALKMGHTSDCIVLSVILCDLGWWRYRWLSALLSLFFLHPSICEWMCHNDNYCTGRKFGKTDIIVILVAPEEGMLHWRSRVNMASPMEADEGQTRESPLPRTQVTIPAIPYSQLLAGDEEEDILHWAETLNPL